MHFYFNIPRQKWKVFREIHTPSTRLLCSTAGERDSVEESRLKDVRLRASSDKQHVENITSFLFSLKNVKPAPVINSIHLSTLNFTSIPTASREVLMT